MHLIWKGGRRGAGRDLNEEEYGDKQGNRVRRVKRAGMARELPRANPRPKRNLD